MRFQLRGLVVMTGAGLALLAGCDDWPKNNRSERGQAAAPATPAAPVFTSELSADISGYYLPTIEVRAGVWRLKTIFVGQAPDFADWQAGRRIGTFAPVMFEFEDETSPMTATELGEVRSGQTRVLPTLYEVRDDRIVFEGRGDGIGDVRFEGRLDPEAVATARRNLGDEAPVLTGTLRFGGRRFEGVHLGWWGGD